MAITVNNVRKTYTGKKVEQVNALRGVSFALPEKGLTFILGKSGCGKSTLLNLLGGLDSFDGGDIVVDGKSMKDFSAKDYDDYRNDYVGFVFQENNLLEQYTVKRNVGLALELQSQKGVDEKIAEVLEQVDLKDFGERRCNRLSGGQKQRVAIARALIKEPEMLLCDEPTGSLDSDTGKEIFELLKEISKNTLVVVVSHDRDSAEKYGDRVIEIKDGTVLSDNKPEAEQKTERKQREQKKSGLPVKRAFAIGAGFLIARPIRLILCLLICLITFTGIGISDTFGAFDYNRCVADNLQHFKTSHMSYVRKIAYYDDELKDLRGNNSVKMNASDAEKFKTYIKSDRYDYRYDFTTTFRSGYPSEKEYVPYNLDGFVSIAGIDANLTADYGFELYGKLPESDDEIVISRHMYRIFEDLGYKIYGGTQQINGYDDLIGKTLTFENVRNKLNEEPWGYDVPAFTEFKIVGILNTRLNEERYGKYLYNKNSSDRPSGLDRLVANGMDCTLFVSPEYVKNVYLPRALEIAERRADSDDEQPTSENIEVISGILTPKPGNTETLVYCSEVYLRSAELNGTESSEQLLSYFLENDATCIVDFVRSDMWFYKAVFTWVSLGLVVVAVLFLLYHISGVIADKKREIGVLRALGASRRDILKLFCVENGIFACFVIVLSVVLSCVGALILNAYMLSFHGVSDAILLSFKIRQFAVLASVALGAIAAGVAIPIIRLLRAKPVDIIAGRK